MSRFSWRWRWSWRWSLPWQRRKDELPADEMESFVEQEKRSLQNDVAQIRSVNEYLLNKAISREWISEDVARVIRTTQADTQERPE